MRASRLVIVAALLSATAGCAAATARPEIGTRRIALPLPAEADALHPEQPVEAPAAHPVVKAATRFVGTRYVWGGTGPAGFDCSGFVRYVYAKLGILLPRTVKEQYLIGTPVSRERLRAGDVVFFDRLGHNGVYIGDGRVIHASSLAGVRVVRLDDEWFRQRWVGARRL